MKDYLESSVVYATSRTNYDFETGTGAKLMPEDTLKIDFTVSNTSTVDAYVLAKVEVVLSDSNNLSGADATNAALISSSLTKWYGIRDLAVADNGVLVPQEATTVATVVSKATTTPSIPVHLEQKLNGEDFGNVFQGRVISVKVSVYAIQRENLSATEAFDYITGSNEANIADIDDPSSDDPSVVLPNLLDGTGIPGLGDTPAQSQGNGND